MDLISVGFIVLTWNSINYISDCLNSIVNIPNLNTFISVYDNGSTDGTQDVLKIFQNKHNILVTYSNKNIGTTKSRNIAFSKLPNVDIICVLDSDAKILDYENFYDMVNLVKNDKDIGLIGPRLYDKENKLQFSGKNLPSLRLKFMKVSPLKKVRDNAEKMENIDYDSYENDLVSVGYLMSACFLLRKEIFLAINGFTEKIFYAPEDVDFCAKIWELGYSVYYYKKCSILHHWQRISRKKLFSKHNFEHIKGLFYYSRKYGKKFRMKVKEKIDENNN